MTTTASLNRLIKRSTWCPFGLVQQFKFSYGPYLDFRARWQQRGAVPWPLDAGGLWSAPGAFPPAAGARLQAWTQRAHPLRWSTLRQALLGPGPSGLPQTPLLGTFWSHQDANGQKPPLQRAVGGKRTCGAMVLSRSPSRVWWTLSRLRGSPTGPVKVPPGRAELSSFLLLEEDSQVLGSGRREG